MKKVTYGSKQIPVLLAVECLVVGGGTAGVCAALGALEMGVETLIIEKTNALGGTQTNALVSPMMPTYVKAQNANQKLIHRLESLGIQTNPGSGTTSFFNTEALSFAMQELILEQKGTILYDVTCIDCLVEQGKITHIIVHTIEGLGAIAAQMVVDASADACVSRMSGVPVESGDDKHNNQQMSFRFEMGGIAIPELKTFLQSIGETFGMMEAAEFLEIAMVPNKAFKLEPYFRKGIEEGLLNVEDLKYFQGFTQPGKPGVMSFNCPHIPDIYRTTDALLRSQAVIVGRQMQRRLVRFLVAMIPGFEHAYLLKEATQLGIRESYRIVGQYVLTETSYFKAEKFPDGIARGDWYIDVHSAKGNSEEYETLQAGAYYEIPYRCLITNEITNLVVAGRHLSATFLMEASVRIQPTLRDVGYSAGIACGMSKAQQRALNQIDGALIKEKIYG